MDECDFSMDQIKGIGLGAPGAVNAETGEVLILAKALTKETLRNEVEVLATEDQEEAAR